MKDIWDFFNHFGWGFLYGLAYPMLWNNFKLQWRILMKGKDND